MLVTKVDKYISTQDAVEKNILVIWGIMKFLSTRRNNNEDLKVSQVSFLVSMVSMISYIFPPDDVIQNDRRDLANLLALVCNYMTPSVIGRAFTQNDPPQPR